MKKLLLFLVITVLSMNLYKVNAQVGIGTDMPNPSTQLEIISSNRGIMIPQVPLTGNTDQTTISAGNLESLLVYNINTNATLTPGYYYWYQGSWNRLLTETDLPDYIVFWDVVNNQFTYIDENGDIQIINIADLETLTFLGLNADGKTLEYTDENGDVTQIDLEQVIKNFETLTTIVDNGDGTFTFTDENGNTTVIDISNMETLTYLALNSDGKTLEYTDENGNVTSIDLATIIKNYETITHLVNNGDGTYSYTNEAGDVVVVDIIGDVVTNIQNQGAIYDEIMALILAGSDVFVDNGDGTFTHTAVDGTVVTFDANTTTMVNNGNGTYTFTNANGDTITVDVIGDVVTNIQTQGAIYDEIMALILAGSDVFVDNGDGTFTHTAVDGTVVTFDANTTTMLNNGDGTYTFTNANGDTITVDVIGDVVTNIQTQGAIYDEIMALIGDPVTANNGLTETSGNIQLGGVLIKPTAINTDTANTLAVTGLQNAEINDLLVVADPVSGVLRQSKSAMPKFFYMPAIIFDTSVNGTFTRNLHAEYLGQFTGTSNPTLVGSSGAPSAIPNVPTATDLYYYITYYDTDVFDNISIDANGTLTYDIIGNATEASYMTIVFVVKD